VRAAAPGQAPCLATALLAALLASLAALSAPAHAQSWQGLQGLAKVALEIGVARELPGLGIDTVEIHLEQRLHESQPAPAIERGSEERLQLELAVHQVSSSELRGFYLPFSGDYAIGSVRLAVVRPVRIGGREAPVPAITWHAERQVRGPWASSGRVVLALVDDMLDELLQDYRRAAGPGKEPEPARKPTPSGRQR
jgi:hypothetical protein